MRTRLSPITFVLALGACNPFPGQPPVTPDEAPLACPCPGFAHPWHPGVLAEDPDHPGECMVRSRSRQWVDAREHPACQREARERAGREGR